MLGSRFCGYLALVKYIAQRAVVQYHNLAQVWLDRAKIFDVGSIPVSAMLPVMSPRKVLSLLLQPIDNRVRVFLYRSCKNNKIIPFTHISKKVIAVRSFMYVIEDGMLRSQCGATVANCCVKLDLYHVAAAHSATFRQAMYQSLV